MRMVFGRFAYEVHDQLFLHCQDEVKEYYSKLYPQLAVQGLQILKGKSNFKNQWWNEIINLIEPIKKCKR